MKTVENLAKRYNNGKPQWSLVHYPSLEPLVRVLEYGAEKYTTGNESGRDNWKKGLPIRQVCESMLRHIYAFLDGEDNDPESKISHIGHIQANAMFLAYMMRNKPELDDRCGKERGKEFLGKEGKLAELTRIQHKKYIQSMKEPSIQYVGQTTGKICASNSTIENLGTQYKNTDKLYTDQMGGHYVGNVESEESKSIIDSKV